MSEDRKQQDQAIDPEHEARFLELVKRALVMPSTAELKEEERKYDPDHSRPTRKIVSRHIEEGESHPGS